MMLAAEADFGLSLLRQLPSNEATILSPLSVALALSVLHIGCKGETKRQIGQAIGKGATDKQLVDHYSHISDILHSVQLAVQVNIANRFFVGEDIEINDDYLLSIEEKFHAEAQSVDFSNTADALEIINGFVSSATYGKIPEILSDIDEDTKAMIVNALYFRANWLNRFSSSGTKTENFESAPGKRRKESFMSKQSEMCLYYETDQWQVLSLPYENQAYVFSILLPKTRHGFASAFKGLNGTSLVKLLGSVSSKILNVHIPRFKLESGLSLTKALQTLGIKLAFTKNANLDGIGDDLKFSKVEHRALIEGPHPECRGGEQEKWCGQERAAKREECQCGQSIWPPNNLLVSHALSWPHPFSCSPPLHSGCGLRLVKMVRQHQRRQQ